MIVGLLIFIVSLASAQCNLCPLCVPFFLYVCKTLRAGRTPPTPAQIEEHIRRNLSDPTADDVDGSTPKHSR